MKVLALDLEGTLISNAVSQIPRPGLYAFLVECRTLFSRLVIFSTVPEGRFRAIAALLVAEGAAPSWFCSLEYVRWKGKTKDLACIPGVAPADALLVDDYEGYVHPSQYAQWVRIALFAHPYPATDEGLPQALRDIRVHLGCDEH